MSLYGWLYRNGIFPAYERLRGRAMLRYLDELEQSQWLPMKEIEDRQWRSFTEMLRHAYEQVPFYKRRFGQAGIKPKDIQSRDDLEKLPFLEKRHLQENQDENIALTHRNKPLITSHSGGSTGQPVAFQYDRPHYDRRCAAWARADRWGGWEIGERQVILWLGVGSGVGKRRLADPRG